MNLEPKQQQQFIDALCGTILTLREGLDKATGDIDAIDGPISVPQAIEYFRRVQHRLEWDRANAYSSMEKALAAIAHSVEISEFTANEEPRP